MADKYFNELALELHKGASEKDHPFRQFCLGTVGLEGLARLRTVVLRETTEDLQLFFFTDSRSKKIIHIKENNKVGLLFYHPKKFLQLRIEGLATVHSNVAYTKKLWNSINSANKKDYTTSEAPGSPLGTKTAIDYLDDGNYFCIVEVTPFKIEYLKLGKPDHLRIHFSKKEEVWSGEFLVP